MDDFSRGDRVRLVFTSDQFTQLVPGDEGTVIYVTNADIGRTVDVKWDSGSGLSMLIDEGDAIARV